MKKLKLIIITFIYMIIYFLITPLIDNLLEILIKDETIYFYVSYIITFVVMLFSLLIFNKYQKTNPLNNNNVFKGLRYLSPFLILFISINLLAGYFSYGILTNDILKAIVLAIVPAFSEEVIYRSNNVLSIIDDQSSVKDKISYALISALLFALVHFINILAGANLSITLYQVIFAFSFGVVSSAILIKTRNILPNVIGHSLFNFSGFIFADILNSEGVLNETVTLNLATIIMISIMLLFVRYGINLLKKN